MNENPTAETDATQSIRRASFVVLDFETVTPAGRPPEPLELAVMHIAPGLSVDRAWSRSWLIKPPEGAPLTPFDTQQTGIRAQDIQEAPDASAVLKEFDHCVPRGTVVFVAHNARYDASIVRRFAQECPFAASRPWIDTLALGKHLVPNLPNYTLDTLAHHFALPIPQQRHRALPDVRLTVQVLLLLISLQQERHPTTTIADVLHIAGIPTPSRQQEIPTQTSLW